MPAASSSPSAGLSGHGGGGVSMRGGRPSLSTGYAQDRSASPPARGASLIEPGGREEPRDDAGGPGVVDLDAERPPLVVDGVCAVPLGKPPCEVVVRDRAGRPVGAAERRGRPGGVDALARVVD